MVGELPVCRFIPQRGLDLQSQVDVGLLGLGVQGYVFGVEFQGNILNTKRSNRMGTPWVCHPN